VSKNEPDILKVLADKMGPLGPIVPEALANLEGWTWKVESNIDRLMLTRGASPINVIPPIQSEIGWLHTIMIVFSDPLSMFHFACDNYTFALSPFLTRTIGLTLPSNTLMYCNVYNPASPMGPIYGLCWVPSHFWPYRSQILLQASHPSVAVTATSQIFTFVMGRLFIRDRKQFYESVVIENVRQSVGRVEVPRRSP